MTIDVNDPRLTAFVLGELEAAESALVAAAVADSPELQAEVAAIRAAAGQVTTALALEPAPSLLPEQRAAIFESAGRAATARVRGPGQAASIGSKAPQVASSKILSLYSGLRAVAAVLAVAVGVSLWRTADGQFKTSVSPVAFDPEPNPISLATASQPLQVNTLSVRPDGGLMFSGTETAKQSMMDLMEAAGDSFADGANRRGTGQGMRLSTGSYDDSTVAVNPGLPIALSGNYLAYARAERFSPALPATEKPSDYFRNHYFGTNLTSAGAAPMARERYPLGQLPASQPEPMVEELWKEGEVPPGRVTVADSPAREAEVARLLVEFNSRASHDASEDPVGVIASRLGMTEAAASREIEEVRQKLAERDPQLMPLLGDIPGLGLLFAPPITDNPFLPAYDSPLSTFSIDVDTAAYTIVRRQILSQQRVDPDSVRIEELVNYFPYDYAPPTDPADPFATHIEIAACPWRPAHRLVRIGLKGREIEAATRPSTNLVFLIDVSGSMQGANRLPLVQKSLKMLVNQLAARAAEGGAADDRIALTVYAGNAGLVLPSRSVRSGHDEIIAAIDRLQAGGSTNGGSGINLAYHVARENFIAGGVNRVILATDGDWNVGVTDNTSLETLIQDQARSGVYLSVLGFGIENLNDHMLEMLADKGDGNYAYIDTENEARKALVDQLDGTLVTIAKDVKIQVEFNPALVAAYRLIGYENRVMPAEDFNDDTKDAGEIGAGHTVTALYEVVPVMEAPLVADAQADADATEAAASAVELEDAPAAPPADFVGPPAPYEARDLERTIANWELGLPDVLNNPAVDPLKYLSPQSVADALLSGTGELLTVKLRYKLPEGGPSQLHEFCAVDLGDSFESASADFRFAASVAAFGMSLRNSPYRANASTSLAAELAKESVGEDQAGLRADFVDLLKQFDGKPAQ